MDRHGFIRDKLDIQILILFILSRLESGVELDVLADLALCDDGISYFDFQECIISLTDTAHIAQTDGRYVITEKGARNGTLTENSLPYAIRKRAEERTAALSHIQRRNALVNASVTPKKDGNGSVVRLSFGDGLGELLSIDLYAASETQGDHMADKFLKNAEEIYAKIVALLTEDCR